MHRSLRFIGVCAVALHLLPSPGRPQVNVTFHDPTRAFAGLTTEIKGLRVSGPPENARFRVFGMNGEIAGSWQSPVPGLAFGWLIKPLPQGAILAILRDLAGPTTMLAELDPTGTPRWVFDPTSLGLKIHHDFQRLPNGNTLVLTQTPRPSPWKKGAAVLDDILLEVDRAGNVVWLWSTVDNAAKLPFSPEQWEYLRGITTATIFHTNSLQALPPNRWEQDDLRFRAGNILVSQRDTSLVFLIDKLTGNVVWSYQGAIGQHHARMIPQDLPGDGNILIYDNGGQAGAPPVSRSFSRILEIDPRSKRTLWSYGCSEQSEQSCSAVSWIPAFSAPFMGSAQRLPNGNTLISDLPNGRAFEVTYARELVWEYLIGSGEQIYRAYRLPSNWRARESFSFVW